MIYIARWETPIPIILWETDMERKPEKGEPSLCVVCAWRETCVKKYTFDGQHCLEYTRDVTIKSKTEAPEIPETNK